MQDEQETVVERVLDEYGPAGHDASLPGPWVECLATLFTPTRFPVHALQMGTAYLGSDGPRVLHLQLRRVRGRGPAAPGVAGGLPDPAARRRDQLIHRQHRTGHLGAEPGLAAGQGSAGEAADRLRLGRVFHRDEPGPAAHPGPDPPPAARERGPRRGRRADLAAARQPRRRRRPLHPLEHRAGPVRDRTAGGQPGRSAALGRPVGTSRRGRRRRAGPAVRAIAIRGPPARHRGERRQLGPAPGTQRGGARRDRTTSCQRRARGPTSTSRVWNGDHFSRSNRDGTVCGPAAVAAGQRPRSGHAASPFSLRLGLPGTGPVAARARAGADDDPVRCQAEAGPHRGLRGSWHQSRTPPRRIVHHHAFACRCRRRLGHQIAYATAREESLASQSSRLPARCPGVLDRCG